MPQSFAILPAAGHSARMGAPKLLLPWRGRPVIQHVLAAWTAAVDCVALVVRADDRELIAACDDLGVDLVRPQPNPQDMKASIQAGLRHLEARYRPRPSDVCLIAPADLPRLSSAAIRCVLDAHDVARPAAIVPVVDGQRGHPILLPWAATTAVHDLQPHETLNSLLKRMPTREAICNDSSAFQDLDTDEDYARLVESHGRQI